MKFRETKSWSEVTPDDLHTLSRLKDVNVIVDGDEKVVKITKKRKWPPCFP